MPEGDERKTKRRLRQPLSCQRCRKHRSKCSRDRPSCEQCLSANVECEYLDAPGDLASTALRERFTNLEDQIDSLLNEFDIIEQLVYNRDPAIRTDALRSWNISNTGHGVSIDTHMHHVEDIYATLIQFALDNAQPSPSSSSSTTKNLCLTRNNQIYPTIKLSHFTSLLPAANSPPSPSFGTDELLSQETVQCLLEIYPTCLLHGSIQGFEPLRNKLLDRAAVAASPMLRLLHASCLCYMLLHACYWHPIAGISSTNDTVALATSYYDEAKELVSTLYFEDESASAILCHAICNLVLYHIESGNTSVIYLYSGMAARLAASLDAEETSADIQPMYVQSIRWFLYSLDTAASHFHNKPYEVELLDGGPPTPSDANDGQRLFQWFEYRTCEITRDIRRTCFSKDRQHVPYKEIERIERKLLQFEILLHSHRNRNSVWHQRCAYMHAIRCHGHWILLHQTYLPTALSLERCSKAAFALVDLFEAWPLDCYFRPCIHELKQACEILEYLVANKPSERERALEALERLLKVILRTPVHDIAKTRPFIQRVQNLLDIHHQT